MQFPHLNNQRDSPNDSEISLLDILRFLKGAYKTIAITSILGLAISIVYLAITPKQYEALAQIAMAQIDVANNTNNNASNTHSINIEEPSMLISRLSIPTSFSTEVKLACALDDSLRSGEFLARSVKLNLVKGVPNVVELRVVKVTPFAAALCAKSIFELISSTQLALIAPYVKEAKSNLSDYEVRLLKAQNIVAKADQSGQAMSATYLSTRDEVRYLLDEMTKLKNIINSNQGRQARLIAPIYAGDAPTFPNKSLVIWFGALCGLFFGLLISMGREFFLKSLS